jgi:potassium efflux system protein
MLLALAMALAVPVDAMAQAEPVLEPAALLEQARKAMDSLRATEGDPVDEAGSLEIRKRALSAQASADAAAAAMAPELADVQARLAELGTLAAGVKESPDVAAQRSQLMKSLSTLDSQIKLARLLAVEAEQTAATASANRRLQFSARLGERAPTPLGSVFWTQLASGMSVDLPRLRAWGAELRRAAAAVSPGTWLAVAFAVAASWAARAGLQRVFLHLASTRVPAGRLRRSLYAVGVLVARLLAVGLAAHAVVAGLLSAGTLPPPLVALLERIEGILWFGGFVAGLGMALLSPSRPSWRLPPVSDGTALRLRWFPPVFAAAIVLGWVSTVLSSALEAGLATTRALQGLSGLTYALVIAAALAQWRRSRCVLVAAPAGPSNGEGTAPAGDHPGPTAVPAWLTALHGGAWLLLSVSLVAWMAGYLALAAFAVNQLAWGSIVLGAAYLLAVLVDDLFMTLLATAAPPPAPDKPASGDDRRDTASTPRTREQTAVLLSGLGRVLVGLFAVVLLMAPYGEGPVELLRRAGRLGEGLSIGEVSVKPAAVLQAVLVLVLGLLAVRLLKDWFARRYMPTTRMDEGMRASVNTLFGYVGVVAVVSLSMSAAGVGLERVAWVASALSVGIGFGLQAVVQNFVSGLILLAERPVKVGDWVSLAGVEGDIRRINVRATEIQMGDRSTVIVPNSEFITKIVRNVTYTDPLGMVQIKLPMPLSTDTRKARDVLMEAFAAHPGVLATPPPNVQLDGIDGGNLVFNASGFVGSPRAAYGVRSDLLFDVLERLREAGLALGKPPTLVLSQGAVSPDGSVPGEPDPPPAAAPSSSGPVQAG